jgi:hypothetical protein
MVPVEQLPNIIRCIRNPGYASVYSFSEDAALEIAASGMSRDFAKYEVTSDTLPIDLDDGDASLGPLLSKIDGLKYDLYTSGGKGYHVILHHTEITSTDLPHSHKKVVETLNTKADMTLYQAGRILSLPARIHPKTGRLKELIRSVDGALVEVPLIKKPEVTFDFSGSLGGDVEIALLNLLSLQTSPPPDGTKHMRIWGTTNDLLKAGFCRDAIVDFISKIVESWPVQLSEEELMKPIDQACRRVRG